MWLKTALTKVLLIEDMNVIINPKVHHKSHIEKIMFQSVIGRPQKFKLREKNLTLMKNLTCSHALKSKSLSANRRKDPKEHVLN